jgi:hypothetical protein
LIRSNQCQPNQCQHTPAVRTSKLDERRPGNHDSPNHAQAGQYRFQMEYVIAGLYPFSGEEPVKEPAGKSGSVARVVTGGLAEIDIDVVPHRCVTPSPRCPGQFSSLFCRRAIPPRRCYFVMVIAVYVPLGTMSILCAFTMGFVCGLASC